MVIIGGYYDGRAPEQFAEEIARVPRDGAGRLQVQGRRHDPGGGRRAGARGARGGRRRLHAHDRRQPGLHGGRRARPVPAPGGPRTSAGSRSPAAGTTTSGRCATCACAAASPCAPARASTRRAAAATSWRRARSTSATSTRPGPAGRPCGAGRRRSRSRTTSRWATTRSRRSRRTCSRASRTGRTSSASTPTATRSGGTSSPTGRELVDGELPLPTGPGLGWELDWDYIERHRADR